MCGLYESRSGWLCNSGGESSANLRTSASTVRKYTQLICLRAATGA